MGDDVCYPCGEGPALEGISKGDFQGCAKERGGKCAGNQARNYYHMFTDGATTTSSQRRCAGGAGAARSTTSRSCIRAGNGAIRTSSARAIPAATHFSTGQPSQQ
eukprot:COSAG02_NODE_4521_length_5267_cov_8.795666_7_plen_104_part_01